MNKKYTIIFEVLIILFSSIVFSCLILSNISIASAQDQNLTTPGCCGKTGSGGICFNTIESDCNESFQPNVKCEDTADCKLGCCINTNNGECNPRTPKKLCEENGRWIDKENCEAPECLRGCCVIGTQTKFITEKTCKVLSDFLGLQKDFRRQIVTEIECLAISYATEEGACVFEQLDEKECRFLTQQECKKIPNAVFEIGKLCSDALPGKCLKQDEKKCVDGKDPVYWFDSCGNKESIAEKCDRFTGTTCGLDKNGEAYCKDLDCHNIPEKINGGKTERGNGESWCVYEGDIYHGVPGSSHYRVYCIDGGTKIESCFDARAKICIEKKDETQGSYARCISNPAPACLEVSGKRASQKITDAELEAQCKEIPYCEVRSFNFGSPFQFKMCLPQYSQGFADLNNLENSKAVCQIGSFVKKRYEVQKWETAIKIEWKCIGGCDPGVGTWGGSNWHGDYKKFFINVQDNLCSRVSDCGADVNLQGRLSTNGISLKIDVDDEKDNKKRTLYPSISSIFNFNDYAEYAETAGDYIPISNLSGISDSAGWPTVLRLDISSKDFEDIDFFFFWEDDWLLSGWDANWDNLFTGIGTVIGYVISFVANVIAMIWNFIWGAGNAMDYTFYFTCSPWQPPRGGENCEKCSELGVGICNKYKCESLGQACVFEDEDNDGDGDCLWEDKGNVTSPVISPLALPDDNFVYSEISASGFKISKRNGECLNQFEKLNAGISTDKKAICKYGFNQSEMENNFKTAKKYDSNHTIEDLSLASYKSGEVTIYVKCANRNGQENEVPYLIRTCVSEIDLTAPEIIRALPENPAYLEYNKDAINITIFVNEPVECKWSRTDKTYESMENRFGCDPNSNFDIVAWPCRSEIKSLAGNESHVYIRCMDNSSNINTESYDLILYGSKSPLSVAIIQPPNNSEIVFGRILEVELKAETSGGATGKAKCSYSFTGRNITIPFFNTGGSEHGQKFSMISEGSHRIYVECIDDARNKARAETSFNIRLDKTPPEVARTYKQGTNLYVETDEDSVCRYTFEDCSFDFESGIEMTGFGKEHQTEWKAGKTYYIKCKDTWDNIPDGCTIKVNTV